MELRNIIEDIKRTVDQQAVKGLIERDLGLKLKNNKCLCFLHHETNPSMSFDKKNKKFKCFSCGQSYDIFNHYQEFYNKNFVGAVKSIIEDFNLNIELESFKSERKIKKEPSKYKKYTEHIQSYLNKRGISNKTIDYVGIKEYKDNVVFEYRNELGEHIANKYRRTKKGDKKQPKMWFEKDTNINTLYNMDKIDITKPLLITEGEIDTLAAIESGYKNSVSVPTGCNSTEWIDTNWTFLEQFNEIVIWFDNDEPGVKGAKDISNRLPNNIVKIATHDRAKDVNEVLHKFGRSEVLKTIEEAYTPTIEGITTLDMVEDFNIYETETLKLGVEYIDKKIVGLVFGSLNILTGKNASGKSTILNQIYIAEAIKQGYKIFLFSGELVNSNVKYWLLQTLANEEQFETYENLSGFTYKKVGSIAKGNIVKDLQDKFYLYDSDNTNIDKLLEKMIILAKRYNVRIFILDNLMMIRNPEIKDKYEAKTDITMRLKNFAKKYNSIVHLVAHPRKTYDNNISKEDISGTGDITNLADYITSIVRANEEERNEGELNGWGYDATLTILKNRHTGVEVGKKLKFDIERKRFYSENKEELNSRYLEHENIFDFYEFEGDF